MSTTNKIELNSMDTCKGQRKNLDEGTYVIDYSHRQCNSEQVCLFSNNILFTKTVDQIWPEVISLGLLLCMFRKE